MTTKSRHQHTLARYYTGVGSRKTPASVLALMTRLAQTLASAGWTLRSGAADGADAAFEAGAGRAAEIYLPWRGFNRHTSPLHEVTPDALMLAAEVHPVWDRLSDAARKLHARNCYQVLGSKLCRPSTFLVCWTPDGATSAQECTRDTGGTATAIRLADRFGVPTFNLARPDHLERVREYMDGR